MKHLIVLMAGVLSSNVSLSDNIVPEQQRLVVQACTQTVNSYPYSRDRLLYEEYGNLFTEDAVFILGPNRSEGRDAIVQALKDRGPTTTTRHFSNLVLMEAISQTEAKGLSYVMVYKIETDPGQPLSKTAQPIILGEYHDQLEYKKGECRIKERNVKIVATFSDKD